MIRKGKQHKPRRDATPPAQAITPGAVEKPAEGPQESHTARNKDPRKRDTFRRATAPARMRLTPTRRAAAPQKGPGAGKDTRHEAPPPEAPTT